MSNELKKKEETKVQVQALQEQAIEIDVSDVIIGKILVGQALSDAVKEGKAKIGDIYETTENRVLATADKGAKFVIGGVNKFLYLFHDKEFIGVEPFTNDFSYETVTETGEKHYRYGVLSFMVFLQDELNAQGTPFPYFLNMLKTNYKTGKKLMTYLAKLQSQGKPTTNAIFELKTVKLNNGKHSWYAFDVSLTDETIDIEKQAYIINTWGKEFKKIKQEVHADTVDIPF